MKHELKYEEDELKELHDLYLGREETQLYLNWLEGKKNYEKVEMIRARLNNKDGQKEE